MIRDFSDVNARVAGLSTRLLQPGQLAGLRAARGPTELAAALAATRYASAGAGAPATVPALEADIRRTVGDRLALLDRWLGRRREALRVVYEDEDRRAIRALLRGAAQGAPPEQRLSGLVPTATLPEAALQRLAHAPDPLAVVEALEARGHAFASALRDTGVGAAVDLYRLELALDRAFARRAGEAARHPTIGAYVERVIDLGNAWAALLAEPPGPVSGTSPDPFVEGGVRIDAREFARIAAVPELRERRRLLAERFVGTPLEGTFDPDAGPLAAEERASLAALAAEQLGAKRRDPTGPAPILLYALRLRADVIELRRLLWAHALGGPPAGTGRGVGWGGPRAPQAVA